MSSGTSYDWAYEQERERQRQTELRAELERLRVRHRQLQRLQVALATQGIRAAPATIADVAQNANSGQLSVVVTEARSALDALQIRLDGAVAQRTQERAARWASAPTAANVAADLPPEPSLSAMLAEERTRDETTTVGALARAAAELVETEAARCTEEDHEHLVGLADRVRTLDATHARRALTEIEARVAASIRRRRHVEEVEQTRVELLTLAGELDQAGRAAWRERIRTAADEDLAGLREQVQQAAAAHRHRQARAEVTEQILTALRAQGYELGEPFDDLLTDSRPVTLLTSTKTPDYGVRVTIDADRDRLHATVVRRDDVNDGGDQHAQQLVCADLDRIGEDLAAGGLHLRMVLRRPVHAQVPTMAARHWPAAADQQTVEAQHAERLRRAAEQERQRHAHQQAKGRTT